MVLSGDSTDRQNNSHMEKEQVEKSLLAFIEAVDAADYTGAAEKMAPEFRVVLSNIPQKDQVTILDKNQYLQLMKEGKVGGKKRKAKILLTDVYKQSAIVKIQLESETLHFTNYYSLINSAGKWMVIQDQPQVEQANPGK